jgi:hypothetical protein
MDMTRDEFADYLTDTLIPDLQASGSFATAADFIAAVELIKNTDQETVTICYDGQ